MGHLTLDLNYGFMLFWAQYTLNLLKLTFATGSVSGYPFFPFLVAITLNLFLQVVDHLDSPKVKSKKDSQLSSCSLPYLGGVSGSDRSDQFNQFEPNRLNWFNLVWIFGSIEYNPIRANYYLVQLLGWKVLDLILDWTQKPHLFLLTLLLAP